MTANELTSIMTVAGRRGMSTSVLATLAHIAVTPVTRLVDIAVLMGVTSAAVTGLADRMTDQGLATREAVPGDRRAHTLEITAHGRAVLKSILSPKNNTKTKQHR